jgi:hypothetical protein
MNLDILEFLYTENEYGIFFVISFVILCIVIYYKFNLFKTYEPFWGAIKKVASALDPTKWINDALNAAKKFFVNLLDVVKRPFVKFFNKINDAFKSIGRYISRIPKFLSDIADDVVDALNDALLELKKIITAPMKGINDMITDFKRLICLFESFPNRIANLLSGIDNIFQGVGEQMELILKASALGLKETSTLMDYTGVFLASYIKCAGKFVVNLYKCVFFYIIDIICKILYLPVRIVLWFLKLFLNIDFYPMEERIWQGILYIDQIIYSVLEIHIVYWPETIREQCYTCVRLRKDVVNRQAEKVDYTFKVKIPDMINGDLTRVGMAKIRRGKRMLEEITAMPRARPPNKVE